MNPKALRRLAADQSALYSQPLPPNYLFPPNPSSDDDLTSLDILLAGPQHTPFSAGVWKLHLTVPLEYPNHPPTAHFRTPIFHPNVDPQTGGICVETLKRDWDSRLTLRDVLITISCLLIQPNPDSALNAEAGALIQESYDAFARRALLMASIHAVVPKTLLAVVKEAQERGQEKRTEEVMLDEEGLFNQPDAPPRKKRATARQRGTTSLRTSDGSPSGAIVRRRQHVGRDAEFVVQTRNDDVFGASPGLQDQVSLHEDEDSSMMDADQENSISKSPIRTDLPLVGTPRRPHGVAVPLGEMTMDDIPPGSEDEDDMEAEYPPSPRKSPCKNPTKQNRRLFQLDEQAESSRAAAARANINIDLNITPPNNLHSHPLAEDSPFAPVAGAITTSPHKVAARPQTPASASVRAPLFARLGTSHHYGGILKPPALSSAEKRREEAARTAELNARLWEACGRDIARWNRGDFGREGFKFKAGRW